MRNMEYSIEEQKEALEVMAAYNKKLMKSMRGIVEELSGHRVDDTDEFLEKILQGINWEVSILNSTMPLINENSTRVDKEKVNARIISLGSAVAAKDDSKIAAAMRELLPVFEHIGEVASEVVA